MQKQRAFIQASLSSIPYLHGHSSEMPGRESEFQKDKGFYWGLGAVGKVMAVASANWLGKGPSPVRQVGGGCSRGGGVVKVKDTEQDGVGLRRPALSLYRAPN